MILTDDFTMIGIFVHFQLTIKTVTMLIKIVSTIIYIYIVICWTIIHHVIFPFFSLIKPIMISHPLALIIVSSVHMIILWFTHDYNNCEFIETESYSEVLSKLMHSWCIANLISWYMILTTYDDLKHFQRRTWK